MTDPMLPLAGLSPVAGKAVVAKFDGGLLSSDGGVLALREVERRLGVADRLAACLVDRRAPDQITHSLSDIIRFRLLMISAGYEDGNDASRLRGDPLFKMAMELTPSDRQLCSQSTISRLENLPDVRALLRMGRAMVDLYCASFREVPKRITLDVDDTFDAVHGGQQLRLFNAHYDDYGFQPMVVFDGAGRFVAAMLRPARRPSGKEARAFLRRLLRAIRANWRAPRSCCAPTVTIAVPRFSTGVGPTASITFWASPRTPPCAATPKLSRPAPRRASRRPQETARSAASRSSSTPRRAEAASSGSSLASRRARKAPIRASSSPISPDAALAPSMRRSTAGAARPKTTSSPSRLIWRRIARHAPRLRPISSGCSCMPAPTG